MRLRHTFQRQQTRHHVTYRPLSRARSTYEDEGLPGSLVPYADVLVALSGADRVAAGLLYEGVPTLSARWGLQLCAAVDRAGFAAPWEAYLTAWDNERGGDSAHDATGGDEAVFLAELRGRIRLPGHGADKRESTEEHPLAQRVARFLDQEALDSPEPALGVLQDCLGAEPLLESAELIERPERRAALLLHLADIHDGAGGMLPSARTLAAAAWASAPCASRRLLDHGVPVADLAASSSASASSSLRRAVIRSSSDFPPPRRVIDSPYAIYMITTPVRARRSADSAGAARRGGSARRAWCTAEG
jgi:hypothetical protein